MTNFLPPCLTLSNRLVAGALQLLFLSSCSSATQVQRVRGDVTNLGRPIPAEAYAAFMNASSEEQKGSLLVAEQFYLRTLQVDPQSGAAWAGLIRTGCSHSVEQLHELVRSAKRHADRPALALVALANCLCRPHKDSQLSSIQLGEKAEDAARKALDHEPSLVEASDSLSRALLLQNQPDRSYRVCRALELYTQKSCSKGKTQVLDADLFFTLTEVDKLLLAGKLNEAIDAAAGLIGFGEIALRLLALGAQQTALEFAQKVRVNDPDNPSAQLVISLSSRPLRSESLNQIFKVRSSLGVAALEARSEAEIPPLGQLLLAQELLRIEPDSAQLVLHDPAVELSATTDPLVRAWLTQLLITAANRSPSPSE